MKGGRDEEEGWVQCKTKVNRDGLEGEHRFSFGYCDSYECQIRND